MSTPADFWSKIGQRRGVAQTPAAEKEEKATDPTPAEASNTKKTSSPLVFRSRQNSAPKSTAWASTTAASPLTPSTSMSWADSVEEDEARAAGTYAEQCKECTRLADTVIEQTQRIEDMEAVSSVQVDRIAELEALTSANVERIAELEHDLKGKDQRIEQLEGTLRKREKDSAELGVKMHENELRIQRLVGQAKEATHLQQELQQQCKLIRELELQIAENISIPDSGSATEGDQSINEEQPFPKPTSEDMPIPEDVFIRSSTDALGNTDDTSSGALEATPGEPIKGKVVGPLDNEFPALPHSNFPVLGSPTPRDFSRPVFVTPSTIKKVAPVPPPPKLKLGIDTKRFGKKPEIGPGAKHTLGSRRGNEAPLEIDPSKDIRRMSKEERLPFGNGPTIHIMVGNEIAASLPKHVFMQCSFKAYKHWNENPNAQTIKFDAGVMTKAALDKHVEWMVTHTYCNRVYSVSLRLEEGERYNLELVKAARVLGLHSMYVAHFTKQFCQMIRNGPSDELVALIEELVYQDNDPIFDCLANCVALAHEKAGPKELADWSRKRTHLPKLSAKIQEIAARRNFALGKSPDQGKRPPPTREAEEVAGLTATAEADPDADWLATGPAWM
ncbi:hypothetical protein N0V90_000051 [Kalmusia sp. IMI 367209]|nr:hypothetical protein N0V90_000051 [Kalmusia sp. IMI 367209]